LMSIRGGCRCVWDPYIVGVGFLTIRHCSRPFLLSSLFSRYSFFTAARIWHFQGQMTPQKNWVQSVSEQIDSLPWAPGLHSNPPPNSSICTRADLVGPEVERRKNLQRIKNE